MGNISERVKNLPPEKVNALLRQLRPGATANRNAPTGGARTRKRLFRTGEDENFYLDIEHVGNLDSLTFKTCTREPLAANQVEVETEVACLNFRDIAISLGIYPVPAGSKAPALGCDGSGRVVAVGANVERFKVGDEVFFSTGYGSFSKYARADEMMTYQKPRAWSFEEAAGLAVVFVTVFYSLRVPGRLAAGERILIHSAAGGIGLAAIQMARLLGAQIYATAGTEEKREYLRGIGIEHVMDSRSLEWVDELRRVTAGEGVDVILNSLSGEAIARGVGMLRADGRFVELGKRDLSESNALGLSPFLKGLTFSTIDLNVIGLYPHRMGPIMEELRVWIDSGRLHPLPDTLFMASRIADAFRFMTTGNHIGRITVRIKGDPVLVAAE
jgi:NADPH:quinone reductase-like Zn-dependent oxidoreductase